MLYYRSRNLIRTPASFFVLLLYFDCVRIFYATVIIFKYKKCCARKCYITPLPLDNDNLQTTASHFLQCPRGSCCGEV